MIKPKKEQIVDWSENPVTLWFKELVQNELKELAEVRGLDAYHPFEPTKTQEIMAGLNGAVDTWSIVLTSLDGEGLFMEEEDEYDGDYSVR